MTFHPDSLPDLTGKVYIVTGGTSGIGYYTVARLAQHGAHVYLCARSQTKGDKAIADIRSTYAKANITLLEIDHLSLSSVVSAAKHFLSLETSLHGLINNAGIMATPRSITADGHEAQFQTNYLAHWVLTSHLLPLLLSTSKSLPAGSVRIVNLSSSGHYAAPKGGINLSDPSLPNETPMARYGQSKLANVLHTTILHSRYGPSSPSAQKGEGEIWTTTVHPGYVESNIGSNAQAPLYMRLVFGVYGKMGGMIDGDTGAWTSVYCAAGELKREESGAYFQRIADAKGWRSSLAKDEGLAEKLEGWTAEVMKREGWVA
ncbi:NAD(P)-binding protein [Viridothelium virens]|uniref:NAD(P)-binding protein n=1 Tax=Viridothelium virens TaxID=1048519 RepID=A0A6A6GZ61_VIRVR|nr:NAD(P)-binding protein [Viridothelium virens]